MKNISKIIIASILITFINCKAQNPVVNLDAPQLNLPKGSYIKDINNVLNPFEGTWVFDDGVNYLKIVLQKNTNLLLVLTIKI